MTTEYYIGVMSGTSCDGIDVALANFTHEPHLIAAHHHPMPSALIKDLNTIITQKQVSLPFLYQTENQLSQTYVEAINTLVSGLDKKIQPAIRAVGCHGQTIYHAPNAVPSVTTQLLDPSYVAHKTNLTVVADFRRKDVANGGQGAPFVPIFHNYLFQDKEKTRLVLNIGGIANISVLQPSGHFSGFDTGPGNCLIDKWVQTHWQQPFDNAGLLAREGKIIQPLLDDLLQDPYFHFSTPKSTGREYFNQTWLDKHLAKINHPSPTDTLTTLTELTAQTIACAIKTHQEPAEALYICGGGAFNVFLLERIEQLSGLKVFNTNEIGLAPEWVESMAFAWFAKQSIEKKPLNITSVTGGHRPAILGGVFEP